MATKCLSCGDRTSRHQIAKSEYDPVAPVVAGGMVWHWVFALSRKRRFRCDRSGASFYAHTMSSRVWLVLWIWFLLSVAFGILTLFIFKSH
jgi:hypothetical protein